MNTNLLNIKQFKDVESSPVYREPEFKSSSIDHVCVVRKGTVSGKATVDFVFVDEHGQKYATMITADLIKYLAQVIGPDEGNKE